MTAAPRPLWTVKETYYWDQVFPAGRGLDVTHSYVPGVGGSVGIALGIPEFLELRQGRREQALYCTDRHCSWPRSTG